jgi:hypothetical protein
MSDLITVVGAFVILVGPFFWMILSIMSGKKKAMKFIKSTYVLVTVASTLISVPSVYFLYAFYSDRSIESLQITCIGLRESPSQFDWLANYTLVVGFHSPLPWSIHATWLVVTKVTKTFLGSNSSNTELWLFPSFSNITISPGTSQSRLLVFDTTRFGLTALQKVVVSVTLVEDYTGPLSYAFHRTYTNPDPFTLNSINNRVITTRDFDSNVITAFLFEFVTLTANYGANSYVNCPGF